MKAFYIISVLVVAGLALTPFYFLDRKDPAYLKDQVVAYGTYGAKVRSIDPATCGDTTSAGIQGAFYEGLYTYDFLLRPLKVAPLLAEDLPQASADNLTYTIRIRKGVKYHRNPCFGVDADGTPKTRTVRAADFELAFKRIADYYISTSLSLAFIEDKIVGIQEYRDRTRSYDKGDFSRYDIPIEGIKVLDEHTLQIRLVSPWPQLVYVLALNNYAPVPRELIDYHLASRPDDKGGREPIPLNERDPEIREAAAAVGTGAYYLAEWTKGNLIVMRRNEDFRPETYPAVPNLATLSEAQRKSVQADIDAGLYDDAGKPVPFTDVSYLTFVQENNPMWMLFMTRQTDSAGIPREMYNQVVSPDKELTDQWTRQGIRLIKYTSPAVYWYAFNMEDRVVGNSKSLRQALSMAFNVEDYIEVLFNGRGIRALNTVPGDFEGAQEAGPSPYARFDLDAARAKLRDAREELVAAGVIEPGEPIPPLTLDFGGRDEDFRRMGEFAQQQFRQIGVTLNIELNDWPTLQEKVHKKQVQMYSMGWHADYPDPENFLQLYYSPNIKRGTNNTNYSNPQFDRLYDQAAVMMPSAKRTEIYVRMIRMVSEDCPVLLLTQPVGFFLSHSWVHNIKPHPIGYGYGKYRRIDAEARRKAGGR